MKAYGKTKRNGNCTVKASARKVNINALLTQDECITKTYPLKRDEYFAKQTSGGNMFVCGASFEAYVNHEGVILRETKGEFDFVDSFESDWEVVSMELYEPMYWVKLNNYNGCIFGLVAFLEQVEQMQSNSTAQELIAQLKDKCKEANWSMGNHYFKDYGFSDKMLNHVFGVYLTADELEFFDHVETDLN